jgi:hypothetical protein
MELYDVMRRTKVSKSELARRLDVHPPQVDRLLDVYHPSRLDQLERAFEVLGERMLIAFQQRPVVQAKLHRGVGTRKTGRVGGSSPNGMGVRFKATSTRATRKK